MLSMHSEEQYARRTFWAGASGYIMKLSDGIRRGDQQAPPRRGDTSVRHWQNNWLTSDRCPHSMGATSRYLVDQVKYVIIAIEDVANAPRRISRFTRTNCRPLTK